MGGDVAKRLLDQNIPIQLSPPYRQHQNGLVEQHWQEVIAMARNCFTQSLLPSEFWFFGIKRACEVCNILSTSYMPNKTTTPFEVMLKKSSRLLPIVPYVQHSLY